jgi:toxin FitB
VEYLLDTNVVSETYRRTPDPKVKRWMSARSTLGLWLSVLTLGELAMGVDLAPVNRRNELRTWIAQNLRRAFAGRLLSIDDVTASEWGRMRAEGRSKCRELPAVEGLLLATAKVRGLVFVTRNERDCADRGVTIVNPWS